MRIAKKLRLVREAKRPSPETLRKWFYRLDAILKISLAVALRYAAVWLGTRIADVATGKYHFSYIIFSKLNMSS